MPSPAGCTNIIIPQWEEDFDEKNIGKIFKIIMDEARRELDIEYNRDRIKGADYTAQIAEDIREAMKASVMSGLGMGKLEAETILSRKQVLKTIAETSFICTQESEAVLTGNAQRAKIKEETRLIKVQAEELKLNGISKRAVEAKEIELKEQMKLLYKAQADGFDDKGSNEAARTVSNMWSVFASEVGLEAAGVPSFLNGGRLDSTFGTLGSKVGLPI